MHKLQGKYFDGKTSKSKTVVVTIKMDGIHFYSNEDAAVTKVEEHWDINQIENIDFSASDTIHLKYGTFPSQALLIEDEKEVLIFKSFYRDKIKPTIHQRVLGGNLYKVLGILLCSLVAIMSFYLLVVVPFVAEKAVTLIPPSTEITLGNTMTEQLLKSKEFNTEKSAILQEFYDVIGFESTYPVQVYFEENCAVNAFAVPGGTIVVFEGIIGEMTHWGELAGLLGHELAHVEKRHSLKRMCRSMSTYIVFSVVTGDVSGIAATFVEGVLNLYNLSNSREAEREADRIGMQYLVEKDINPQGMVDLFKTLHAQQDALNSIGNTGKRILEILSTHPLSEERIVYLNKEVNQYSSQSFPRNEQAELLFEKLKE